MQKLEFGWGLGEPLRPAFCLPCLLPGFQPGGGLRTPCGWQFGLTKDPRIFLFFVLKPNRLPVASSVTLDLHPKHSEPQSPRS